MTKIHKDDTVTTYDDQILCEECKEKEMAKNLECGIKRYISVKLARTDKGPVFCAHCKRKLP